MNDIRSLLEEEDPLRRDPGLPDAEAARMRVLVLRAARNQPAVPEVWQGVLAIAAIAFLIVVAGTMAGPRTQSGESNGLTETPTAATVDGERRQVQFATPGGTRIIWTLDPGFKLGEVVP